MASRNEIMYISFFPVISDLDSPVVNKNESFAFEDGLSPLSNNLQPGEDMDIETGYKQTERFIILYKELQTAPDILKATSQDLKILGHQLAESVDALKCQAQLVLDQSASEDALNTSR